MSKKREDAKELAREMFRLYLAAQKGGRANTFAQNQARAENLKKARWKQRHPHEPYQDEHR